MIEQAFISMVKTMSWLPPIFLGMVSVSTTYIKNADDWGMVQMALFQPHDFRSLD
jgi:hypothetical protein